MPPCGIRDGGLYVPDVSVRPYFCPGMSILLLLGGTLRVTCVLVGVMCVLRLRVDRIVVGDACEQRAKRRMKRKAVIHTRGHTPTYNVVSDPYGLD